MSSATISLSKLKAATTAAESAQESLQFVRRLGEKIDGLNTALVEAPDETAAAKVLGEIEAAKRELEVAKILAPRKEATARAAWQLVQSEARNTITEMEAALEPLAAKYAAAVDGVMGAIHPQASEWSPRVASTGLAVRLLIAARGYHHRAANTNSPELVGLVQDIEQIAASLPSAESEVARITSLAAKVGRGASTSIKPEVPGNTDRELAADHH